MADFVTRIILQNQQFKSQLQDCKKEIASLKGASQSTGSSLGNFNGLLSKVGISANGSGNILSTLGGTLGKLGGFFGVAMSAGALFNEMLDNSQTLGDAVERAQTQAGSAVDYFATCLVNADFSNFINGLQQTIEESGKLADALDDLATAAQQLGVIDARVNAKRALAQKHYYEARTKEQKKAAVEEMKDADKMFAEAHSKFGKKNLDTGRQQIRAIVNPQLNGKHLTDNQIDYYFLNEEKAAEQGKKANKKLQAIVSERNKILNKGKDTDFDGPVGHKGSNPVSNLSAADKKRLQQLNAKEKQIKGTIGYAYSRINEIQDNKENAPMTQARNNIKEYYSQQAQVTQLEANTARKEAMAESYKGGSSTKKGNKKKGKGHKTPKNTTPKKVYKETATTIEAMEDNIDVLSEKLKKCVPNSESYKEVESLLEKWKDKLSMVGFDVNAKTIKGMSDNIQILSDKLQNLDPNTDAFKETTNLIESWQTKLDDINNNGFKDSAKSIKDINNNIQILNYRLNKTVPRTDEWFQITKQIKQQKELLNTFAKGSIADLNNQIDKISEQLQNENLTVDARVKLETTKKELQDAIDTISDTTTIKIKKLDFSTQDKVKSYDNAQTNISSVTNQRNIGLIDKQAADSQIADINKQLQALGLKPIKVHIETDFEKDFADFRNNANDIIGGLEGIGNVVNSIESLSNALANGADAWTVFMGVVDTATTILQTVGSVMTAVNTITELLGATTAATAAIDTAATSQEVANSQAKVAANSAEAISGATKSGAQLPFPLNIVAIAAGLAAVIAGIAMIGSFADGGVIGGNSFHGDNMFARVNAGEMILNNKQQGNLFRLLDGGGVASNTGTPTVKIKGSDLYVALNNYGSKIGKIR